MSELFPFATEYLIDEAKAKRLTKSIWPELTNVWARSYQEWNSMSELHRGMLAATSVCSSGHHVRFLPSHCEGGIRWPGRR